MLVLFHVQFFAMCIKIVLKMLSFFRKRKLIIFLKYISNTSEMLVMKTQLKGYILMLFKKNRSQK